LLAAMMAFQDGDFSVRLPVDWDGTAGGIAEAFNQALAHEDRISQEVARLRYGSDVVADARLAIPLRNTK
jgi:hypothetical protein